MINYLKRKISNTVHCGMQHHCASGKSFRWDIAVPLSPSIALRCRHTDSVGHMLGIPPGRGVLVILLASLLGK